MTLPLSLPVCKEFPIWQLLSYVPKGAVSMQKNSNNSKPSTSIQSIIAVSVLQMGKLRPRGLISFLSIVEEREANPEPVPRNSDGSLFNRLFSCQSPDRSPGAHSDFFCDCLAIGPAPHATLHSPLSLGDVSFCCPPTASTKQSSTAIIHQVSEHSPPA